MEFLNNSDFDQDDDGDDDVKIDKQSADETNNSAAVAAVQCKWTELSDEDDSDSCDGIADAIVNDISSSGNLPKADDLFSSVVTQFISKEGPYHGDAAIKPKIYVPVEVAVIEVEKIAQKKSVPTETISPFSNDSTSERSNAKSGPRTTLLQPNAKGATPKPIEPKQKELEKDTAKDRVKRQRLSGQSGIGTDFKTWKSEEEMRQRQQYD
jgi:hypothetical protein